MNNAKVRAHDLVDDLVKAFDLYERTGKDLENLRRDEKYFRYKQEQRTKSSGSQSASMDVDATASASMDAEGDMPSVGRLKPLVEATRKHELFSETYTRQFDRELCVFYTDIIHANARAGEIDRIERQRKYDVLAIDAEMIETAENKMALARLSVVDAMDPRHPVVMDTLVKQTSYIVDTRQSITGLTKEMIEKNGIAFEECRLKFASILHADTILVGHALDHDLVAIKLRHVNIIDTAFLFRVGENSASERRNMFGRPYLHSLDYLTEAVLRKQSERENRGGVHDSCEDAILSWKLVKELLNEKSALTYERHRGTSMFVPQRQRETVPKRRKEHPKF